MDSAETRALSDEELLAHFVAAFGPCTCSPDEGCDEEGVPGCALCQALDPEWLCPAEDPIVGKGILMRTDFCDYPSAWEIQREAGDALDHDPKCSAVQAACFLCDCGAVLAYWQAHYFDGTSAVSRATPEELRAAWTEVQLNDGSPDA